MNYFGIHSLPPKPLGGGILGFDVEVLCSLPKEPTMPPIPVFYKLE